MSMAKDKTRKVDYLVDGEHLAIALLHLLQLPQEVPAQRQEQPSGIPHRRRMIPSEIQDDRVLTRTCSWRAPRWLPRASCGRSSAAHRRASAARGPPPGTDETADIHAARRIKNTDQAHEDERGTPAKGWTYPKCHHSREQIENLNLAYPRPTRRAGAAAGEGVVRVRGRKVYRWRVWLQTLMGFAAAVVGLLPECLVLVFVMVGPFTLL